VGSAAGVLALQRSLGNRAVTTLLARCSGGVCRCGGRCQQDEQLEDPRLGATPAASAPAAARLRVVVGLDGGHKVEVGDGRRAQRDHPGRIPPSPTRLRPPAAFSVVRAVA
jgi:hypothetical protein